MMPTIRRTLVPPTPKQLGTYETCPIFRDGEVISGKVVIRRRDPNQMGPLDHAGITIEFRGTIEMPFEKGGRSNEFASLRLALLGPTDPPITQYATRLPFTFGSVKMPHESYDGQWVSLRYCLRVTIKRPKMVADMVYEKTLWVVDTWKAQPSPSLTSQTSSNLEIGLQNQLHLHLEFDNTELACDGVLTGYLEFTLVNLNTVSAELLLQRREITPSIQAATHAKNSTSLDQETLYRFTIMEGPAMLNDKIPFRFYLAVVIVDDEGKRYFKQQEIVLQRA